MVVVVTFSSLARIWGVCSTVQSLPAFFSFFFFFRWRLVRAHQFHSLCQDRSTVAQRYKDPPKKKKSKKSEGWGVGEEGASAQLQISIHSMSGMTPPYLSTVGFI